MKKNEDQKKEVQDAIISEPLMNSSETGVKPRAGNYFRKIIYIGSLAVMGLCVNSCIAGFIATEPAYVEYSKPPRPSNVHIWIDGDYAWNNQTHVYVQRAGYWEKPRQGQVFVTGHWQSTSKGKSWSNGHWQKEGQKNFRSRRN